MRKNRKLWTLVAALAVFVCVSAPVSKVKGSADLIVPDDYEYEDTWDDSYLLDNLKGEQTIKAEGTPPSNGEASQSESGCAASITLGGVSLILASAVGVLLLKKKKD